MNPARDALPEARRSILGFRPEWLGLFALAMAYAKLSGIRFFWHHAYAGQAPTFGRLNYYFEFAVTAALLGLAVIFAKEVVHFLKRVWPLALFTGIACVFALTKSSQPVSVFLAVSGYIDALIAVGLALSLSGALAVHALLVRLALLTVLLNVAALAMPSVSVMLFPLNGFFRGFIQHRNELAQVAAICAFIALSAGGLVSKWLIVVTTFGAVGLIALASSVQGFLLFPLGVLLMLALRYPKRLLHPMALTTVLCASAAILTVMATSGGVNGFLALFGRDTSFTGRDRIWDLTFYLLDSMPLTGYGVGNFGSDSLSPVLLASFGLGTHFGTAHNSYLDACLTYGWTGGALFLVCVLFGVWRLGQALREHRSPQLSLAVMLASMCVLGGFMESSKLFLPTMGWFTFVLAVGLANLSLEAPVAAARSLSSQLINTGSQARVMS